MILSQSTVSKVELIDGAVYKTQPKFMTDNEIWILERLYSLGFVPYAIQVALETIKLEYVEATPATDVHVVARNCHRILWGLKKYGIRHGDLTIKNLIVRHDKVYVIDFSESRLECDPRPDKRPEGDEYWISQAVSELNANIHI